MFSAGKVIFLRREFIVFFRFTTSALGRLTLFTALLLMPLLQEGGVVFAQTSADNPLFPAGGRYSATGPVVDSWQHVEDSSFTVIGEPTSQVAPAIDGNRVVWQDDRLGPADIYFRDLANDQIVNLTNSAQWESTPDIAGDVVVWRDGYDKVGIHGQFLSTGELFTVTTGFGDVSPPRISDNYVVWAAHLPDQNDWHIYGFDLNSRTQTTLADGPGIAPTVNIDQNLVVWSAFDGRLFLYDRSSGKTTQVGTLTTTENPDVSVADHLLVWQDHRNSTWDIYGWDLQSNSERIVVTSTVAEAFPRIAHGLVTYQSQILLSSWNVGVYDLNSKSAFPITDNSNVQAKAVTDGTTVVWEDNRNHQPDIYAFVWTGTIPAMPRYTILAPSQLQVGAFPGGAIRLQWSDNAIQETAYRVERADGIIGTDWHEVAQLAADSTTYEETPAEIGESYWYRVRAVTDNDTSAYSNESFASTFSEVPSLEEQYLLTLLNQARSDPKSVGYPTYPAVAPLVYNPLLAYAARSHSQSILNSGFQFGHCDASGRCPAELAKAEGYLGGCGENLITGGDGSESVVSANRSFLDSQGHRNAMLEASFKEAGMGHTFDLRKGSADVHGQYTEVLCGRDDPVSIPAIPSGAVAPFTGSQSTNFAYLANFYSADGTAPSTAQVVIDGVAHDMDRVSGQPANGTYQFSTQLPIGENHDYYFFFTYGAQQARWPEKGTIQAPQVEPESMVAQLVSAPSACGATITWHTLGSATTSIEFGLTDTYGQSFTVDIQPANEHRIQLVDLFTNTTYHFRLHSLDTAGNQSVSPDQVLTTRRPYTLQVPAQVPTIADALAQAQACDIVDVAAGDYPQPGTLFVPAGVLLMGAGPLQSNLTMNGDGNLLIVADKSLVSGFTIQGAHSDYWASGVWFSGKDSPVIINNLIRGNSVGIANYCQDAANCSNHPLIAQNLLIANTNAGMVDSTGGSQIFNNTLVQNADGIRIDGKNTQTLIENNLIVHNQHWGIRVDHGDVASSYNLVWGNETDYSHLAAGMGDLSVDPRFVDEAGQNYRLGNGSPALDAGDPNAQYADADGSRNDMGATGGPYTASPLRMSAFSSNQVPVAGDEVTYVVELVNASVRPESAALQVEIPAQAQFTSDNIVVSGASYQLDGNQVSLLPTDLFINGKMSLSIALQIDPQLGSEPIVMNFPVTVESDQGSQHYDNLIFPNGSTLFLPLLSR